MAAVDEVKKAEAPAPGSSEAARAEVGDLQEARDARVMAAAVAGDFAEVRRAVEAGGSAAASLREEGTWGAHKAQAAIHCALQKGDLEAVRFLLQRGADPNATYANYDWRGCGSSQTAFEMVLALATRGRNRRRRKGEDDTEEERALLVAELVKLCLVRGADPNKKSVKNRHSMRTDGRFSSAPLHSAAKSASIELMRALLEGGADVDGRETEVMSNEYGSGRNESNTALHLALKIRGTGAVAGQRDQAVKLLLAHGANPNALSKHLKNEHIENECEVDDPRDDGFESSIELHPVERYPLHFAVRAQSALLVSALRAHGADIDLRETEWKGRSKKDVISDRTTSKLLETELAELARLDDDKADADEDSEEESDDDSGDGPVSKEMQANNLALVMESLQRPSSWSPETHSWHPFGVRLAVRALHFCWGSKDAEQLSRLPLALLHEICGLVANAHAHQLMLNWRTHQETST